MYVKLRGKTLFCALICSIFQRVVLAAFEQNAIVQNHMSVEQIQKHNIDILTERLTHGWQAFCEAPVDEGVMSLYEGINPSDAILHVLTINNQTIELPIRKLSELRDFDINPRRKTLLYVNAFHTTESYFSVQAHLNLLQMRRRDVNVIVVDFAKTVQQLYYAVQHHLTVYGYFIYKILNVLISNGLQEEDIILAGHSVGANIAALGATFYAKNNLAKSFNGQLIAVDPAIMCRPEDVYIKPSVAARVIVIHGEGDVFGVRDALGHIDIYPNGIGYFPRRKLQPGCETKLCSHMYAFVLFMEALVEGVMIPAANCESWAKFRQRQCDFSNTLAIGLHYPNTANGLYFCQTQPNPPFTFMEHGLRFKEKDKRINKL